MKLSIDEREEIALFADSPAWEALQRLIQLEVEAASSGFLRISPAAGRGEELLVEAAKVAGAKALALNIQAAVERIARKELKG